MFILGKRIADSVRGVHLVSILFVSLSALDFKSFGKLTKHLLDCLVGRGEVQDFILLVGALQSDQQFLDCACGFVGPFAFMLGHY